MVGTAEYQVVRCSLRTGQNVIGSNLGGTTTVPPDRNVAIVEAMSPWMWNRGITQSATSLGASAYVEAMLPADAKRLRWRSGTSFGRLVVPLVWSTRAMSSSPGEAAVLDASAWLSVSITSWPPPSNRASTRRMPTVIAFRAASP